MLITYSGFSSLNLCPVQFDLRKLYTCEPDVPSESVQLSGIVLNTFVFLSI